MGNSRGKVALITGVTGQDGAFLAQRLVNSGLQVFGSVRRGGYQKTDRLKQMGTLNKLTFVPLEISEFSNVMQILSDIRPDYIYNLAAQSFVIDSFRHPIITTQTNYIGVLNILESIKILKLKTKFFQPSTSEMYGPQSGKSLGVSDHFNPQNPYALSKYSAHSAVSMYRDVYGIDAVSAILFNHESEVRGLEFVTRKITYHLARMKNGESKPLQLGNLGAERDWGYAKDYMEAIELIMLGDHSLDFIVATNKLHSVREFLKLAASYVGFNPVFDGEGLSEKCFDKKTGLLLCEVKEKFFRYPDTKALRGDFSLIRDKLSWKPKTDFEELVKIMSLSDLNSMNLSS